MKSDRRDPEPDPGQAHRRGAVRGAQAEPGRGVQEDRRSRSRSPASARARSRRASSTSGSAAARCSRRPSTRRSRSSTARRVEENDVSAARPARGRHHRARRRRAADVHRRGRRPARVRAAGLRRHRGHASTTPRSRDEDIDEQLEALRERFATLTGVERAAADGDFVSIDLSATVDGEEVEERHRQGPQLPGRLRRRCSTASTRRSTGLSAGERPTFTDQLVGGDHAGEEAEVTVDGQVGQGARAARARRRLRPARQRVRHPRRAARRPPRAARAA